MADGGGPPTAELWGLLSIKVALASVMGSAVGAVLGTGKWWERALRGTVGIVSAIVGHKVAAMVLVGLLALLIDEKYLPTVADMEPAAAFMIGVVGMVFCQAAINYMTALRDRADDFVDHQIKDD